METIDERISAAIKVWLIFHQVMVEGYRKWALYSLKQGEWQILLKICLVFHFVVLLTSDGSQLNVVDNSHGECSTCLNTPILNQNSNIQNNLKKKRNI